MQQKIKVIYILGHSRSGSTLLGFHLGGLKDTFFAGEIKRYGKRVYTRQCTCGKGTMECIFWSKFIRLNKAYFSLTSRNDNILRKAVSNFKYLLTGPSKSSITREKTLLANLYKSVNEEVEACQYIVDSSKSLNRLVVLESIPEIEVYTLYLTRNVRHNLASFVKRKQHLFLNFLRLRVNDKLINWYLKNRSEKHLRVSYEDFVSNPQEITEKIFSFTEMPESTNNTKPQLNYHVITGSSNTRKAYAKNAYVKISNKNSDEPFSPRQLKILKFLGL
jgi:hypothetical protein